MNYFQGYAKGHIYQSKNGRPIMNRKFKILMPKPNKVNVIVKDFVNKNNEKKKFKIRNMDDDDILRLKLSQINRMKSMQKDNMMDRMENIFSDFNEESYNRPKIIIINKSNKSKKNAKKNKKKTTKKTAKKITKKTTKKTSKKTTKKTTRNTTQKNTKSKTKRNTLNDNTIY